NPALSSFTPGQGAHVRETVTYGTISSPAGVANKTTREITIENELGSRLFAETLVFDGGSFHRVEWTAWSLDQFDRVASIQKSDGSLAESVWSCCGKESDVDAHGVTKRYTYDALQRFASVVKEGVSPASRPPQPDITTTYTYDAASRQLSETISADDLSLHTSREYDLAGRLGRVIDPAGRETLYAHDPSRRMKTVTLPGGAVKITTRYLDGRLKSVTGSGVIQRRHEYGVNEDGSTWSKVYTGGPASPMWERTTVDPLGRTIRVERPGFKGVEPTVSFNGVFVTQKGASGVDLPFTHDALGRRTRV
ncbi:MAG: RHS repeat protein, partial [Desulfobacterales bacterium]|nr:RHS repeat protein [Desulfobacterales bacterium]